MCPGASIAVLQQRVPGSKPVSQVLGEVFLPGESQGRGSLVGCCLWGRTELDTTEATWQQQQQYVQSTLLSPFHMFSHLIMTQKEMATHSRVLAWRIPGTVEPGGLLSVGSHRVGHD